MLKVSSDVKTNNEETVDNENMHEFKGIYFNDTQEQKYYEGGAHFKYTDLYNRLDKLLTTLTPERKGGSVSDDNEDIYKKNDTNVKEMETRNMQSSFAKTKANSHTFGTDNKISSTSKLKEIATKTHGSNININSGSSIISNKSGPNNFNHMQSRNNTAGINNLNSNNLPGQGTRSMIQNQTVNEVSHHLANNSKIQNVQINLSKDRRDQGNFQDAQAKDCLHMMKTYNNVQHHVKSNSMSYNIGNLPMNQQGVTSNLGNYLNGNNKKIQPKIVKNSISRINPINLSKNTNTSNITTNMQGFKKESENLPITVSTTNLTPNSMIKKNESHSRNGHLKSDFLRAANNTKNNLSYMTKTKMSTSPIINNNISLNSSNLNNVTYNNNNKIMSLNKTPSSKNTKQQLISNMPSLSTKLPFNINISNNHSRNINKNEISTLSDLTSSINRDRAASKDSIIKTTNVIVKPKINISFVNNINNLMTSIESLNHHLGSKEYPMSNYQNIVNNVFQKGSSLNNYSNKKSRNEKTDSFLSKSSNSNNASRDKKLPNYRTMMTSAYKDYRVNRNNENKSVKTQFSINLDSFSKDKDRDTSPGPNNNNINKSMLTGNSSMIYLDKKSKHSRNSTSISNQFLLPENSFNNSTTLGKMNQHSSQVKLKPNITMSKEPTNYFNNLSSSNYLYLKQRISNLKLGVGKFKPTPSTNAKIPSTSIGKTVNNFNNFGNPYVASGVKPNKILAIQKTKQN